MQRLKLPLKKPQMYTKSEHNEWKWNLVQGPLTPTGQQTECIHSSQITHSNTYTHREREINVIVWTVNCVQSYVWAITRELEKTQETNAYHLVTQHQWRPILFWHGAVWNQRGSSELAFMQHVSKAQSCAPIVVHAHMWLENNVNQHLWHGTN